MRRREFITLLGSSAAAWPLAARAQQPDRLRRIGVLMYLPADNPDATRRVDALLKGLHELGWTDGRSVQIDMRWGVVDAARSRRYAAELVALAPDVILVASSAPVGALLEATRTIPVVFVNVSDPVGAGFVASLARPGGNATGFAFAEYTMAGKWPELLKEIMPRTTRVAVLRDPTVPVGLGQFGVIQSAASALGMEVRPIDVRDAGEIERAVTTFARAGAGGLVLTGSPMSAVHRDLIIRLAAAHRLPAVYPFRDFAVAGGLTSYGPDPINPYRQAAGYIDRILKGEKPADLPVQAPTKYEMVINLKTAKALGLTVPDTLLARADEVIE